MGKKENPGKNRDFLLFTFFYYIHIRAEVALVAAVLIVASSLESGREHHAGHQRAAGGIHLLHTIGHGVQSVSGAQNKTVGVQFHGNDVLHQAAKHAHTKQLLPAHQVIAFVSIQALEL